MNLLNIKSFLNLFEKLINMRSKINLKEDVVWRRKIRHVSARGKRYPIITLPAELSFLIGTTVVIKIAGEKEILLKIEDI